MRRIASMIVVLLALFSVQGANAQTGWVVVLYNPLDEFPPNEAELIVITENGVLDPIPVPKAALQFVIDSDRDYVIARMNVTPDLRYMIVLYGDTLTGSLPLLPLSIFNLEDGSQHTVEMVAKFPRVYRYAISPDGSQLAVAYRGYESALMDDQEFVAGLMLVDIATGDVLADVDMDAIREAVGADESIDWVETQTWVEGEGIPFVPGCFYCREIDTTPIWIWNPSDNTFTESGQYYFPSGVLPHSGEVLIADLDDDFPIGESDPNAYLPESNVIKDYAPGLSPKVEPTVVFFDEDRFPLSSSTWVYDGRAFITRQQGTEEEVMVFRDGSVIEFEVSADRGIVIGTPDGVIILNASGKVYDYRVMGSEIVGTEIAKLKFTDNYNLSNVMVLYTTPMGISFGGKEFPSVAAPGSDT